MFFIVSPLYYIKREAQEDIDQMLKKVKAKAEAVS